MEIELAAAIAALTAGGALCGALARPCGRGRRWAPGGFEAGRQRRDAPVDVADLAAAFDFVRPRCSDLLDVPVGLVVGEDAGARGCRATRSAAPASPPSRRCRRGGCGRRRRRRPRSCFHSIESRPSAPSVFAAASCPCRGRSSTPGGRSRPAPRRRACRVRSGRRRPRRRPGTRPGSARFQPGAGLQLQHLDLRAEAGGAEGGVADFVGVAAGVGEDLADVPVGVVVGEDRAVGVGGHAGGAEVAGGGEDRVFGVVRVGDPVAVGVDPVVVPGRGHELHPADRAGRGGAEVGAEAGLDLVDPGQDRRALRAEPVLAAAARW